MEPALQRSHEDHIAAKGREFFGPLQYGAQIHFPAESDLNSGRNSSSTKRMGQALDNSSSEAGQGQEQERGFSGSTEEQEQGPLRIIDGLMSSFKNAELVSTFQKYKGRVVFREDIAQDDAGAYAVFTEQGSSASEMTTAKAIDVIARLPDRDGQAADAVSAFTQVQIEDPPKLVRILRSACPDLWVRIPQRRWPKWWSNI